MSRRRACLVVPAAPAAKLAKGATLAADEVVLDLEDAVVPAVKDEARGAVADALAGEWAAESVAVRVNAIGSPWCHLDLAALAASGRDALTAVLPKVEHPDDLAFADRLLDGAEAAAGRATPVRLLALIETAAGLAAAAEIARASERLDGLILGYADLAASLGRTGEQDWRYAQETVLVAARAAGIQAIDGPYLGTRDDDAFRAGVAARAHARLRRQVGDPPGPARRAARRVHADRRRDRRRARGARRARSRRGRRRRCGRRRRPHARRGARAVGAAGAGARRRRAMSSPPWFEDLEVGTVFDAAPALTLTDGHAALHQAIAGDRLRLALDRTLGEAVAWRGRAGRASGARVGRGDRPVDGGDRARGGEPLLPRADAAPGRCASATRCARRPRSSRGARTASRRGAGRPGSRCCASAPSTRTTGRCSTSPAARCCRSGRADRRAGRRGRRRRRPRRTSRCRRRRRASTSPPTAPRCPGRTSTRARRLGGRDRGRRRRRLGAGARAPDGQRRDGPPRRHLDGRRPPARLRRPRDRAGRRAGDAARCRRS